MNDDIDMPRTSDPDHGGRLPKQRRAQITREGLLEVAAQYFNRAGFAGTAVNEIIAASGSTKGALYFHFSSKETLAQQVMNRWSQVVADVVAQALPHGVPAQQRLVMIFRELAHRAQKESIPRAGLILSLDSTLGCARSVYEGWTSAIHAVVADSLDNRQGEGALPAARLVEALCAGFAGAVQVGISLAAEETISRRVDDVLWMWRGADPAAAHAIEGAAL